MSYPQPDYRLSVNGQDITPKLGGRLIELRLSESRGEEADQLSLTLDDADGRMAIPPKGATIDVQLGWAGQLVDKGSFVVDETEHSGAPDRISIRARSANMGQSLRQRTSRSWHNTTLGAIVQALALDNDLPARIAPTLAQLPVQHLDQTNESDLHLLTRLARQHDAVATIKKGQLIFLPINSRTTASGKPPPRMDSATSCRNRPEPGSKPLVAQATPACGGRSGASARSVSANACEGTTTSTRSASANASCSEVVARSAPGRAIPGR